MSTTRSFGLQVSAFGPRDARETMARLREVAAAADASGFRSLWLQDHFVQADLYDGPRTPQLEAMATLGALAACTERVHLGVLVCGVTYRNPALLAKATTTVDVLSGGRAILGIGAAWNGLEHEAYGWPFPSARERLDRLEEAVQVCRLMFTEEAPSFAGRHHRLEQAWNQPRPIRPDGIPILVGGMGEQRTLRIVARLADMSNVTATPAEIRRKHEVLDRHCKEVGRDPAEIHRTCMTATRLCRTDAETEATRAALEDEGWPRSIMLAGSADAIAAGAVELYDAGVDEIIVNMHGTTEPGAVAAVGAVLAAVSDPS